MATTKARVEINQRGLSEVQLGLAYGVGNFANEIAEIASILAPDGAPFGTGLPKAWGWAVYVAGKKVLDGSGDGTAVRPPRELRVSRQDGLSGFVGFGFPGRFQEFGTVHHGAQPFLSPAVAAVSPAAAELIGAGAKGRL